MVKSIGLLLGNHTVVSAVNRKPMAQWQHTHTAGESPSLCMVKQDGIQHYTSLLLLHTLGAAIHPYLPRGLTVEKFTVDT